MRKKKNLRPLYQDAGQTEDIMNLTRALFWLGVGCLIAAVCVLTANLAFAYDATFNFSHPSPNVVQSFRIKHGNIKGGPYPNVIQCGKPTLKADGTYDCLGTNISNDPMYAVAVAVDLSGQESAPSNEAMYDPIPPPPTGLKYTISGNVILTPAQ